MKVRAWVQAIPIAPLFENDYASLQVPPIIVSEQGLRMIILGIQNVPVVSSLRWAFIAFKGDCMSLGVMISSGKNDSMFVSSVEERVFYHLLANLAISQLCVGIVKQVILVLIP